jgi:hypothetical protein
VKFKDCIIGKIQSGEITKEQGEQALKDVDARAKQYFLAGRSEEAAELAAEDFLANQRRMIDERQRNLRQSALKQQEINADFESKLKESGDDEAKFAPKYASDLYQRAAFRGQAVRAMAYKFMDKVAKHLGGDFFETGRDYRTFEQSVRALLGDSVNSPEAKQIADVMKQTFDYLHARYKAAGGIIGKIDNYFPQVHTKEAIRKVSKEEWVNYTFDRLDREAMIDDATGGPFAPEKLKEILAKEYDSIVTGGRSDMLAMSKKGEAPAGRAADRDQKRNKSRFMVFKDADSFLDYNRKFGVGDEGLVHAYLSSVDSMARDIGVLETMGPRPTAISRFMDFKMKAAGSSPAKRKWTNAEFRVLTSKFEAGDVDAFWWRAMSGTQNWIRSSMLGSASISALSDTVFIAATAKINGLSPVRAMHNYAKVLAPGDREAKQIARRSGFIIESIAGNAFADARFAGEAGTRGFTQWLAGLTNKFSGLGAMTKATQDGIALEGMATIADQLHFGRTFGDLDPDLQKQLKKFGLNESDWQELGKVDLASNGDGKFLITSDLRVDPKLDAARAKEIADKIDDWVMHLRQSAANEATLATRALTTGAILGDGGPATASRALMSSLFMFKSFPITVIMTHMLPAIRRARVERNVDHLAMTLIGTTMLGALAMQLKDITKGKTTKDMDSAKFWHAAMLQGGGMGLFGDFIFGDYSRMGRNPMTEVMGPMYGLAEDVYTALKGNLDKVSLADQETNVVRDLFRVAKRNTPLSSLWYGRLAVERLIMDNVERWADPQYDRRLRRLTRKMNKETGQQFWWAPGDDASDVVKKVEDNLSAGVE